MRKIRWFISFCYVFSFCSWIWHRHAVCDFVECVLYDLVIPLPLISFFCSYTSISAVQIISHVWFGGTEIEWCCVLLSVLAPQAVSLPLCWGTELSIIILFYIKTIDCTVTEPVTLEQVTGWWHYYVICLGGFFLDRCTCTSSVRLENNSLPFFLFIFL